MELSKLEAAIEAILFASGDPIARDKICEVLSIDKNTFQRVLGKIQSKYSDITSGIELLELDGSYQISTKPEYSEMVIKALETKRDVPLSQAALEVLSIVSYNQPVSRGFIEQVRGVDSTGVIVSLCKKGLIEESGRLDLPGRPIAYQTTENFLRCFGISSLSNLPELPEEDEDVTEFVLESNEDVIE